MLMKNHGILLTTSPLAIISLFTEIPVWERLILPTVLQKNFLDRSFFCFYIFTSFDLFDLLSKNAFEKDAEAADMAQFVFDW